MLRAVGAAADGGAALRAAPRAAGARPARHRRGAAGGAGRPRRLDGEQTTALVPLCESVGRRLAMDERDLCALRYAATLHDIGELGVPESILGKPGPLTGEERPPSSAIR